jgi:hypothetical protein
MRTAAILLALIGALALVVGCGDDTEKPKVNLDTGVNQEIGVQPDTAPVKLDGQGPTPDTGSTGPAFSSGAICSQAKPCTDTTETCLLFTAKATEGLCHGKCNTSGVDCKVPDSTKQLSKCAVQDSKKQWYCSWLCDVQGKIYECPNATDYKCEALNPQQPDVKYCVPKG